MLSDVYGDRGGAVYNAVADWSTILSNVVAGDDTANDQPGFVDLFVYVVNNDGGLTGAGGKVFLPAGTYRIESTLIVPPSVALVFARGAAIHAANNTSQLVVEGTIEAGAYPIVQFDSTHTQPVLFGDGAAPEVRPEWFGAQPGNIWGPDQSGAMGMNPESILDSTAAFRAAVASLPRTGGTIQLGAGQYKITEEIVVDKNSVVFRGTGRQGGLYSADTHQFGSMLFFGADWTLQNQPYTRSLLRFTAVDDPDTGLISNAWGCGVHDLSICQYPA
jgi:hypothetical protein